jgi:hypothetical protein
MAVTPNNSAAGRRWSAAAKERKPRQPGFVIVDGSG